MVMIKALDDIGDIIAVLMNDRAFYQAGGLVKMMIGRMNLSFPSRDGIESFVTQASPEQSL